MWCSTKHCRIIRDKLVYVCDYIVRHSGSTPDMSTSLKARVYAGFFIVLTFVYFLVE